MTFSSYFEEKKSSISKPCVQEEKNLSWIISLNKLQYAVSSQCLISQYTDMQTNCSNILSVYFYILEF